MSGVFQLLKRAEIDRALSGRGLARDEQAQHEQRMGAADEDQRRRGRSAAVATVAAAHAAIPADEDADPRSSAFANRGAQRPVFVLFRAVIVLAA